MLSLLRVFGLRGWFGPQGGWPWPIYIAMVVDEYAGHRLGEWFLNNKRKLVKAGLLGR